MDYIRFNRKGELYLMLFNIDKISLSIEFIISYVLKCSKQNYCQTIYYCLDIKLNNL